MALRSEVGVNVLMCNEERPISEDGPIAGGNYGSLDFSDNQYLSTPEWFDLDQEPELLTPGAIKQAEGEVEESFIRDLPQDAYTDEATQRVLTFLPNSNPTSVVDREYLLADKSELIRDAATQFQQILRKLAPVIMAREPKLSRIVIDDVQEDGHIAVGSVIWDVEIAASNQPGIQSTWTSIPMRRTRIEVPIKIQNGQLEEPHLFTIASNRVYPLTIEGCQLALKWHKNPVFKKMPPRVERSWMEERDYRAF